jgi:malonate transporter and related proteins
MLHIIGLITPLFAIIAMGRTAISLKFLDPAGLAVLNGFTYWVALPALLFGSIAEVQAPHLMDVAGIYLVCCILVFAISAVAGLLLGASLDRTAVFGLNATYGNVIFLGTPLVSAVFGPQGVSLIMAIIALHSGVLLPLAAVLIEVGAGRQGGASAVVRNTVAGLLRNPIMWSIFLGLLWRLTGLNVPAPLHQVLMLLGNAAAPLALFCLGGSLPAISGEPAIMREAVLATIVKLTILPVCVGTVSWMMGLSGLPWRVAVVTAAMPTGANAFLLARRATAFAETSASTVVVATAASVITITELLNWFH